MAHYVLCPNSVPIIVEAHPANGRQILADNARATGQLRHGPDVLAHWQFVQVCWQHYLALELHLERLRSPSERFPSLVAMQAYMHPVTALKD